MENTKNFTDKEAKTIGEQLGVTWDKFDVEQFRKGMDVELEHGTEDQTTNITNNDPLTTGKIALAHLNEFPDYYKRLREMEIEAEVALKTDAPEIKIGEKYRLSKNGDLYTIVGLARHSGTHDEMVIYQGHYDSPEFEHDPIWIRSKKDFFTVVIINGQEVPRFTPAE